MLLLLVAVLPYWTGIATFAAAVVAAILSGISLFVTGRREERRWKREVLRETMVSLFDSSFNSHVGWAVDNPPSAQDRDWYIRRALDAHAVQMDALTRLRFLARPKVLRCAFDLHHLEDEIYSAAFHGEFQLSKEEWKDLEFCRAAARTRLFNASRRNLGLRRTDEVSPNTDEESPNTDEESASTDEVRPMNLERNSRNVLEWISEKRRERMCRKERERMYRERVAASRRKEAGPKPEEIVEHEMNQERSQQKAGPTQATA